MKSKYPKLAGLVWILQSCAFSATLLLNAENATAAETKTLQGHVPEAIAKFQLQPTGSLPETNHLHLAIDLSLHNKEALTNLLQDLYNPGSTNFHHFLTPDQFVGRFGPPQADYDKVIDFAQTNGFQIGDKYQNRQVLDVSGAVSDIERAFHVKLRTYHHPTENRDFFAPEADPSVDASVPIVNICGLDNFMTPHHASERIPAQSTPGKAQPQGGSGASGLYLGKDFRNAYVPGVSLTGSGQWVGLFELQNWTPSDVSNYEAMAGLPEAAWTSTHTATFVPPPWANGTSEANGDIEMVVSMAPGASFAVFQGDFLNDLLGYATGNPQILQFSSSWTEVPYVGWAEGAFMQLAAQGQSMFQCSGDHLANTIQYASDSLWVTSVGGTELYMNGSGTSYNYETVWNNAYDSQDGAYWGSCGGVSGQFSIPPWQQGVNMSANGGSTTMRNVPDVALVADNILVFDSGSASGYRGTSYSTPLWAAFMALVNEQLANNHQPPVGFLNPIIYSIGTGSAATYAATFHDITSGNNEWPGSPNLYVACPGYDLCTGWGSINGMGMINYLSTYGSGIWVDFINGTDSGTGTYASPFRTLNEGVTAASPGGNVWIKTAASSSETVPLTIGKSVIIRAYSGPATVGQ